MWARYNRAYDAAHLARIKKQTEDGDYDLRDYEVWWRDRQQLLESRGFSLPTRLRPGWIPSWTGTDLNPYFCEDSFRSLNLKTTYVTRTSDGAAVMLKKTEANTEESRIAQLFSTPERLKDSRNHCVPILDHFPDQTDPKIEIIAMPLLRRCDDPPFYFVDEVLDFVLQTLEGLVFMHEQGVAHRDCTGTNVMMDGNLLFPNGFHPLQQMSDPINLRLLQPLRRSDVSSVKYYFIDFGLSTYFEDNDTPRLVLGDVAQDHDVPELSCTVPYDPFPVDVFTLGNMYKKDFIDKHPSLEFLLPLAGAMTRQKPDERPSAHNALALFKKLLAQQRGYRKRWRLRGPRERTQQRIIEDLSCIRREVWYIAKALLSKAHWRNRL
ncbi:hypothetical protein BD410DRAFT_715779 [Rickenella mellea]|uniref:Protein kinase domain-containing protein n=1 Tax=Rickenella mellea TaxID=50990 RepID=A0A4Y7QHZ4_9AGAM|nr:hypothetical protein BD410DRAFT_715779 [Rickenella mellea]